MLWITDQGPGVSPDSVTYIDTARNLLAGERFTTRGKPLTHYPPGYPIILSVFSLFTGGEVVLAARLLTAFIFGFNAAVFGAAVAYTTRFSLPATISMLAFFVFSEPTVSAHSMAWTEGIFIAFAMTAFVLFTMYLIHSKQSLLILASVIASYGIVTRYIGITLIPPIAVALLIMNKQSTRDRIKDTLISLSIMSLPLLIWLLRGLFLAHNPTNRKLSIHPVNTEHATALIETVQQFALPLQFGNSILVKVIIVVTLATSFLIGLVVLIHANQRWQAPPAAIRFIMICSVFSLTYLVFLTVSVSFFDAHTPINFRILLPILLPLTVAGISLAWTLSQIFDRKFIWTSFFFLVSLSTSFNAFISVPSAIQVHNHGRGYTSKHWQKSEIILYLEREDTTRRIYSNVSDALFFLTGKEAVKLPRKTNPYTKKSNQNYEEQLRRVIRECKEGKALIVYFGGINWRWYFPSVNELESQSKLPILHRFDDGVIYGRDSGKLY